MNNYIYRPADKQYISKVTLCCIFVFILLGYSCGMRTDLDLVELGNKYYIEHDYDAALKIYEEALKKNCKYFEVYHNLGSIYYYEKKDFKKAEEIFKRGLLIYPNGDILHYALSQLYFDMDNLSGALKEYKLAVKLAGDRPLTINANKARELLKLKGRNDKEIYDFFVEIINYNPKDSYAFYEVADYEKNYGNYKQALEKYKRILVLNPNMKDEIAKSMGTCYYKSGDYKTALLYFEEARKNGDFVPEKLLQEIKNKLIK